VPTVRATNLWAHVQFREQTAQLLIVIGRRIGPAQTTWRVLGSRDPPRP